MRHGMGKAAGCYHGVEVAGLGRCMGSSEVCPVGERYARVGFSRDS